MIIQLASAGVNLYFFPKTMKTFLIDGYNLINSRAFDLPQQLDLEGQRHTVQRAVHTFIAFNGSKAIIVFDNNEMSASRRSPLPGLQVVFASPGTEADDVIRRMIRATRNTRETVVVSSDRAIRFSAADHGIKSISSEDFCTLMKSSKDSLNSGNSHSGALKDKYGGDLDENDIRFWKNLFESDNDSESGEPGQ